MTFQRETITDDFLAEVASLVECNQNETSDLRGGLDTAMYLEFERLGMIRCFTARRHWVLVGYNTMIVRHHPHHGGLVAIQDALFVDPEHREGMTGFRLMRFVDDELRKEGVVKVYRQTTAKRDISKLLIRSGYHEVETTFGRSLV